MRAINAIQTAIAAFLLVMAGGAMANPSDEPARPHQTPRGFKNNYIDSVNKGFSDLIRWQTERRNQGLPKPADQPTPVQAPDLDAIKAYTSSAGASHAPAITWIGHSSMLVQSGGLNTLTDPIFSERASPVQFAGPKRAQPPGLSMTDLPIIDVVLISHNHYDHLDQASVREIARRAELAGRPTLFMVPLGLKSWFGALGITNVVELDWWDKHSVRGVEFNFTPSQHWSARGFGDHNLTLWGGFAVFAPDFHWYFSGDTGYSRDFSDTAAHFADRHGAEQGGGFDLALLPIGGYEPRWFMKEQHVNPEEAVKIHLDLGAKRSIGVHWGTFELTDESLDQPPKDLAQARAAQGVKDDEFSVMAIGETRAFLRRAKP
jgi:N-acyl-phosphatidylethanolamine-hydrolysing phospholipase D